MSDWLRYREPLDHAARDLDLTAAFVSALGEAPQVVDLACGTGSNFRFLAPKLDPAARWICVDNDARALTHAREQLTSEAVEFRRVDLAAELRTLDPMGGVTCSAFLDLCSATFIDELVAWCGHRPLLATLSFDGRMQWGPADPLDEAINLAWMASRQQDRGFGPALGADAANYLAQRLRESRCRVEVETSDWVLSEAQGDMLELVLLGMATRVRDEVGHREVHGWLERRAEQREQGVLSLRLGHLDVLGLPLA